MSDKRTYKEKLLDPRWQKMRLQVLERDGWQCRSCGAGDKTLHAHHAFYRKTAEGPWDYPADTIIALCNDCHDEEHVDFYGVRNEVVEAVIRAGFVTASQLSEFAAVFTFAPTLSKDEAGAVLMSLGRAFFDREWKAAFNDDDVRWRALLAVAEASNG